MTETTVQFVAHSCLLIRYGGTILLTDPWYGVAFSSWAPCPPPYVSREVLKGMAGRLAISISHAHPDHYDEDFLGDFPGTPVFAREEGPLREKLGHRFRPLPAQYEDFWLDSIPVLDTMVLTVRTPDAFVVCGNDIYTLDDRERALLDALKPKDRPSVYFGQGGSASSWPAMYFYPDEDRNKRALQKSQQFIDGLVGLTDMFDRVVPYAYQSLCRGGHRFIEARHEKLTTMQPGDIYIPADDRMVRPLPTYDGDYPEPDWPEFPQVDWGRYGDKMRAFMDGLDANGLCFTISVGNKDYTTGSGDQLTCIAQPRVMAAVLDKKIPVEDLFVGYLAFWERKPDVYHREFFDGLAEYGYRWMES